MAPPPLPSRETTELMQFIAQKAKNVKSPLNMTQLSRQFQEETGSLLTIGAMNTRINKYRRRIHNMNEFDTETKVKMIFALSAPIDNGFLLELKKIADVEVDDKQRIIHYKQTDGAVELSGTHYGLSIDEGELRDKNIIQFLIEKCKTVNTPMVDVYFAKEFKETTGCSESLNSIRLRYTRVKNTIFDLSEIDKNTKVKMMFISNVKLSDDMLKQLRKYALVNVDEAGRITEYKATEGSLKLEGDHSMSAKIKAKWTKKKKTRGFNAYSDSEEDIDHEFDNQTEMSTERKRARISSPSSEIVEDENPEGEGPSTSTPLKISLLEFLNRLRRPAIKLNVLSVANKISEEIEKLEKKDEQIPINNIMESLEEFIQILNTLDEMASDNETISLSDYLYHLGLSMCYIAHSSMNDFQKKVRNLVAAEDQQIPLEHLRYAMDKTLEKINR